MRTADVDISKLSLVERLQVADHLWGSVAAEEAGLPLTEARAAELDHRLAQLARDLGAGDDREVVRGRVEERLDKAG
jgi:putative addiction module component (TIGR02574 family)